MKSSIRDRSSFDVTPSKLRSAISNGSSLIPDVDHRSAWMRRLRDLTEGHLADLGGVESASEAQKALIRRAAMIALQLELMEQRFAENSGRAKGFELDRYQRCSNTLRRLLETLGLERRPRDITPDQTARVIDHIREAAYR